MPTHGNTANYVTPPKGTKDQRLNGRNPLCLLMNSNICCGMGSPKISEATPKGSDQGNTATPKILGLLPQRQNVLKVNNHAGCTAAILRSLGPLGGYAQHGGHRRQCGETALSCTYSTTSTDGHRVQVNTSKGLAAGQARVRTRGTAEQRPLQATQLDLEFRRGLRSQASKHRGSSGPGPAMLTPNVEDSMPRPGFQPLGGEQ